MPIYKFKCRKCDNEYEDLVPNRGDIAPCTKCGSDKVEKMITAPAKHMVKGSPDGPACGDSSCEIRNTCGCMSGHCPHG